MNRVLVRFLNSSKDYCYLTDLNLTPEDYCVVETPDRNYKVVKVIQTLGISAFDKSKAYKWIVGKVDIEAYKDKEEKRRIVIEIRNKLRDRREAVEEMALFETMAKTDDETKALLTQLNKINSEIYLTNMKEETNE